MNPSRQPHATPPQGRGWAYAGIVLGAAVSIAANVAHSYVRPPSLPTDRPWTPEPGAVLGATVLAEDLDRLSVQSDPALLVCLRLAPDQLSLVGLESGAHEQHGAVQVGVFAFQCAQFAAARSGGGALAASMGCS